MSKGLSAKLQELRDLCEADLFTFMRYLNPHYMYGDIHKKMCDFFMHESKDKLALLPRGHLKSHVMANYATWRITKSPCITIGYGSSTEQLSLEQLYVIKLLLESDKYRTLWPDMIHPDAGKRERWQQTSIKVDHPLRKAESIRDATIHAFGINGNTTGLHFDLFLADDIVTDENSYTDDGRNKVANAYSLISASVLNPGGETAVIGTRYDPKDLYGSMLEAEEDMYDPDGNLKGTRKLYECMVDIVEINDIFLWPKAHRTDGKCFGFDREILSRIRAKFASNNKLSQFYSQYYNNPNDESLAHLNRELFQYYDRKQIRINYNGVYIGEAKLNIFAAMDFAYSRTKKADYTALVIVGMDSNKNIFVLDIYRFKTDNLNDYFEVVLKAHEKWKIRRLRLETTAAQALICQFIKEKIKECNMRLSIEEHKPMPGVTKEERMSNILDPLYTNGQIWHFEGGYIPMLEEELLMSRPIHDDIKDALASVIEIAKPPQSIVAENFKPRVQYHKKFGGVI